MIESEEYVKTSYGHILVNVYGDKKHYPILTFHDIGLNAHDNFHDFFIQETDDIFESSFCVFNINAPGQEAIAPPFPNGYQFPSMDELVIMIEEIVRHFGFKTFIGLGVGAGAHLLLRYAVKNPNMMNSLILINCVETKVGWFEWAQEKINIELLKDFGSTTLTENYLLWHYLGERLWERPVAEIRKFQNYFESRPNPKNVAAFIDSYLKRSTVMLPTKDGSTKRPFDVPVLQIVGEHSAFVSDAQYLDSLLTPDKKEIAIIPTCGGNVLEEDPGIVTETILSFLQENGLVPWLNIKEVVKDLIKKEAKFNKKEDEADQTDPCDGFIESVLFI